MKFSRKKTIIFLNWCFLEKNNYIFKLMFSRNKKITWKILTYVLLVVFIRCKISVLFFIISRMQFQWFLLVLCAEIAFSKTYLIEEYKYSFNRKSSVFFTIYCAAFIHISTVFLGKACYSWDREFYLSHIM